ncbi:MAG: crotonobetainyl-CoA:carnitine CoA-transferase CaiB-like acyl-CoA transferase [Candidatus Poriferisodalaceae bacterium]|jgi:crotonobetainyl-CoA:carnitine CoA-transferase CaiB-like acyl-CoA transferase|tara:strand:+ start:13194 stop:14321 length:1128 start_codon:yes stop_codon:yes gene_type:complete
MPLADLKVIDLSTVFAGPHCARYLADFGADVVKVERPSGDTVRNIGWRASDGETLWWKLVNRGKRAVTLDLKKEDDLTTLRKMLSVADVLIENLRPGKLEALGLIPDELIAINPKLVITRLTGFGQTGPYRDRAGFATLAEAMSGFAAINGDPEGGPLLPPIALTDELAGLAAAFATLVAIHGGGGQSVDVNLLETMMQIMGPLMSAWHSEQYLQERLGSGIAYSVPRGTYQASDGGWLAVSTSSDSVAARVMDLIGAADDTRFTSFDGRIAHRDELDLLMSNWVARRTLSEALNEFQNAEAAAAPVMNMQQIAEDPHILDRGSLIELDGIKMQGLIARLSRTPGQIRWPGKVIGADNQDLPVGNECWFDDSESG